MLRLSHRIGLLHLLLSAPVLAAAPASPDAGAGRTWTQLFIAPSGEPFRAGAGEPYPVAAWFAAADVNHDGKLTEGEFIIDASRFFDSLDLDHDQQLNSTEIQHYEKDIAPEVQSGSFSAIDWNTRGAATPGSRRRALGLLQVQTDDLQAHVPEVWNRHQGSDNSRGGGSYGIINIPEPVMAMDTDLSGIVTRGEMRSAAQRRFNLLDTEERGYLMLADLPETYAQGHPSKARKR